MRPHKPASWLKPVLLLFFESHPSEPWFSDYDDFKHDLKLMAKDYAVVPEFRMSNHVDDYLEFGIDATNKYDTFEIPGTNETSATSSFYLDYSNSEFLKDFLKIQLDSGKTPTQIRLSCKAAIRFNPYRGFYPVQRALEMTSMFSSSYIESILAKITNPYDMCSGVPCTSSAIYGPGGALAQTHPGAYNTILRPLFAPGLLYNSIKAGMAVDYPVVTTPGRVFGRSMTKFGIGGYAKAGTSGSDAWARADYDLNRFPKSDVYYWEPGEEPEWVHGNNAEHQNYLLTIDTRTQPSSSANNSSEIDYRNGSIFDRRLPFEAIIAPEKYIGGAQLTELEPHPSASLGIVTASLLPVPSDNLYTAFTQNFFGEVADFFLEEQDYSSLKSKAIGTNLQFESGSIYMARIRLRRSMNGKRRYDQESGSVYVSSSIFSGVADSGFGKVTGSNSWYSMLGAQAERYLLHNASLDSDVHHPAFISGAFYPLPQDPRNNSAIQETFTLYSRPGAFGPPIAGYELGSLGSYGFTGSAAIYGTKQSFVLGGGIGAINTGSATYATSEGGDNIITPVSGWSVRKDRSLFSPMDSVSGFYWAHTPPYYNGEAWCDVIFRPHHTKSYNVEEILAQSEKVYWRCDPGFKQVRQTHVFTGETFPRGYRLINSGSLISWGRGFKNYARGIRNGYQMKVSSSWLFDAYYDTINAPYGGGNINDNAMQISASIDLFGIEEVPTLTTPSLTAGDGMPVWTTPGASIPLTQQNVSVGSRWVIKPKFETPHMNFNTVYGARPVTASTMPNTFGRASVSFGMWHQYGLPETDPTRGIFLDIDDIPQSWLQNHYDVVLQPGHRL